MDRWAEPPKAERSFASVMSVTELLIVLALISGLFLGLCVQLALLSLGM
jgi:hypothetical protein